MRTRLFAAPFALFLLLTSVGIAAADTTPPAETNLSIVVTSATVQVQTGVVTVTGQITCEVALSDLSASIDISRGRVSGFGDDQGTRAAGQTVPFTTSSALTTAGWPRSGADGVEARVTLLHRRPRDG
jgi:hypothetical protein